MPTVVTARGDITFGGNVPEGVLKPPLADKTNPASQGVTFVLTAHYPEVGRSE